MAPPLLPQAMPARGRHRAGFTLLEVIVTLAILGVVLGVGVPSLATLRGPYALASATRRVSADLQLARQRAIARNARYRVAFSSGSYVLERETAPNTFVAEGGVQRVPDGVVLGPADPANPVFDSRGMLAGDVTVPIALDGVGSRAVTINVLGRTTAG